MAYKNLGWQSECPPPLLHSFEGEGLISEVDSPRALHLPTSGLPDPVLGDTKTINYQFKTAKKINILGGGLAH